MATSHPPDSPGTAAPDVKDTARASVWPQSGQGLDTGIGQEAVSHFDPEPVQARRRTRLQAARLALCRQPMLALRLLLAVVGAAAVVSLPMSRGLGDWALRASASTCAALAGSLLWVSTVCALRERLPRWPARVAEGVAVAAGALAALAGWALTVLLGVATASAWAAGSALVCGGVLGASLWAWLAQRAAANQPTDDSARLAELQSRIRPHFLFNALNTALALVQVDPPRAEVVLEDLSQLFRAALAETGSSVTLDDEVDLAQRYLAIEQVRFGTRLRLTWDLDPTAAAARLPPLVLQPLVENAVRHGVEPSPEGGDIRVRSRQWRGMAVLEVRSSLPAEPGPPGTGVALGNVRERLRLLHDLAGRLTTETRAGHFIARIEVPL